jgi:UDP-N-acetylglucosamine 2-epimerase (non-hydrolysing)
MAPVVHALRGDPGVDPVLAVTAQHRELLDDALERFELVPDHDLGLMRAGQRPVDVLSSVISGIADLVADVQPDWVVVQGDTTTALGAALAASYAGCRVAHVEAGLRTFDKRQPFPEELNRCAITAVADLHLAPTEAAAANLLAERVDAARVHVTGNTVIDALFHALDTDPPADAAEILAARRGRRMVLVTAHRRENFGDPFADVLRGLASLARDRPDVVFVYPVHPNPAVRGPAHAALGDLPNVLLRDPVDYFTMAHLLAASEVVVTDSGGLQEEAPALGKPVLVLRDVTERPEAVDAGVVRLIGTDAARLVAEVGRLLDDPDAYASMARHVSPYGDGMAAPRIVDALHGRDVKPFEADGPGDR